MNLLQAVQAVLPYVGEFPVDSIDATDNPVVQQVLAILQRHKTAALNRGYWFNRLEQEFLPDINGFIQLPDNALNYYIDHLELCRHGAKRYYLRGRQLYSDLGPIWKSGCRVRCVLDLPFDELPDVLQQVLTLQVAYSLYLQLIGADTTSQQLYQQLAGAQLELRREELRHDQVTFFDPLSQRLRNHLYR